MNKLINSTNVIITNILLDFVLRTRITKIHKKLIMFRWWNILIIMIYFIDRFIFLDFLEHINF